MLITHEFKMDLKKKGVPPLIDAVQGDVNTREIKLTLTSGGVSFSPDANVSASVAFKKPDGKKGWYDTLPDGTAACTIAENAVTAILAPEMLTAAGLVESLVILQDENLDQLATFGFVVQVEKNPAFGTSISNDYYNYSTLEAVNAAIDNAAPAIVCDAVGEAVTVNDSENRRLQGLTLYGKTTQNGTPTPEAPVELVSAGNGGTINVRITDGTESNVQTVTAHTPGGLNGIGEVKDEIDFALGVRVQRIGVIESYNGEEVTGAFLSSTGQLTIGAKVLYVLKEPAETPLSADELSAFAELHTNKPNTSAYNDAGAGMKLRYVADTKTYVSVTAVKGEKGDKGDKGDPGADGTVSFDELTEAQKESLKGEKGEKGDPGLDGNGIASVTGNEDGSWTFTYEDGREETVSNEAYVALTERMDEISVDIASKEQISPEFAESESWLETNGDTSKLYVLPDGYIYAYMSSAQTIQIETTQGGYYNSNGELVADSQATAQRTNLIPVKEGDQFEITSAAKYNASVIWYTSAETKISHEAYGGSGKEPATVIVTAPIGAAYARFYSYGYGNTYLAVRPLEESYAWVSTGHAFVPADYEDRILVLEEKAEYQEEGANDPLHGKKIVYDGDSICYGAGYKGGYAKIIAELTGGTFDNQAVGGGRLVTKGSNSWHSVVDNLPNLPTDGDLYCFEGGINDFWTSGMQLGTFNDSNYEDELDTTTVCGALETIFRYALNTFVGKPVCFVITHKIQETAFTENTAGNTFKEYHDAMVGICQKYSIPYYDAFIESGLNGWNDVQNTMFFTDGDGCHPNEEAYKRYYVPQLLDLFRKLLSGGGYYQAIPAVVESETWTFVLEDGTVVEKQVVAKW